MQLCPREIDHLTIVSQAGLLAQRRLARGCRLSQPEATALIAHVVMEKARDGSSVAELMDSCRRLIGLNNVMPGVASLIHEVQVECTFPDGTKLVTVPTPITLDDGDLEEALYGSFLPIPAPDKFTYIKDSNPLNKFSPGHIWVPPQASGIMLNRSKTPVLLSVTNTCDRPIQVGSHYHFIECNPFLQFDRRIAYGRRLNICSGTAIRFEPGESKTVSLVEIGGSKIIRGGNNLVNGQVTEVGNPPQEVLDRISSLGFCNVPESNVQPSEACVMDRMTYAKTFGLTKGDRLRLGDTSLVVEVEADLCAGSEGFGYGNEVKFGGGKGMKRLFVKILF